MAYATYYPSVTYILALAAPISLTARSHASQFRGTLGYLRLGIWGAIAGFSGAWRVGGGRGVTSVRVPVLVVATP